MSDSLDVEQVLRGQPSPWVLLVRGFTKRCPRCGGSGLYNGWFRMKDRCPTCGIRFEREPGFFIGAYFINFAITEGLLFVVLIAYMFWRNSNPDAPLVVPLAIGGVIAVVLPIVFYPFARTIWSAIDVATTPLEMDEIVAALDSVEGQTSSNPEES